MSSSTFKRIMGFVLVAVLLLPLASGCASKTGPKKNSGNVFALPTWKDQSKPKKPKKDPSTPTTMGEAMMQRRNDVL